MRILLTTLNSRYTYVSLALRYLQSYTRKLEPGIVIREYNINQQLPVVLSGIYEANADLVAFSVNIWNYEQTMILCRRLKKIAPGVLIVLGGPEVSHTVRETMEQNPEVDYIIFGEGELTFYHFIQEMKGGGDCSSISGLAYRKGGEIIVNKEREHIKDLGTIPSPYGDDLNEIKDKIIYYETSRGCPFQCGFCLSSLEPGVRYFPLDRVKADLLSFIKAGVGQVKLVDRSFNCHRERAMEIWDFLIKNAGETNFHFEINGDFLSGEMIDLLKSAPPGLFQFEIGVQSTNTKTLKCINRRMDFDKLAKNFTALKRPGNIHLHLDLIAGLPYEDWESIRNSFNDVYALQPGRLQLGFLKLLKGSALRDKAAEYGIQFTDEPPYEVLCTRWLSYSEIQRLKTVEIIVERFYNPHRLDNTLRFLLTAAAKDPFTIFTEMGDFWREKDYHLFSHKDRIIYSFLLDFIRRHYPKHLPTAQNMLLYDYMLWEQGDFPALQYDIAAARKKAVRWLRSGDNQALFPELTGIPSRELNKIISLGVFQIDPRRFKTGEEDITGQEREKIYLLFIKEDNKREARVVKLPEGLDLGIE